MNAKIISSLPSGMETIIILELGGVQLRSVMFRDVDYVPGETIPMQFVSSRIALFDENGNYLSLGSLE